MLIHPTLDQLNRLGLNGMARAFTDLQAVPDNAELTHAEWLGLLLDREAVDREDRRLKAKLRFARLRHRPRSKTSTTAPSAGSTAPCSRRSPAGDGSTTPRT